MEHILSQARNIADDAEVFTVSSEETPVQFEANRLKHIQSKQSHTVALRIIREGRIGYGVSTNPEDIQGLIDMAVTTAEFGMPAVFELPSLTAYPQVDTYDSAVMSVSLEEMVKLGEKLIATVREHTPDIVCEAEVTKKTISVSIINSRKGQADYTKSIFNLGISGTLVSENDMLFVGEGESRCHPVLETKTITDTVINHLNWAKNQASLPSQSLPVIFTPNGVASTLMAPLMAAFNGKLVLEGASPIASKLGEQIFSQDLWLSDDTTIPYHPRSRPCDDEGVASRRTPLIEAGTIANFLYDLRTASLAGTESTGNGSRHGGGLPNPSPGTFIIQAANTTFGDMISNMKKGLIIEYLMGASQGNILGGDFSGNVLLGYKVENGRIVGRVKDTMVSGNVYQVLKDITAIGNDAKWVGDFLNTPSLYCPSLSVVSKG